MHGRRAWHPEEVLPADGDAWARSREYLNTHDEYGERVAPSGWDARGAHPRSVGVSRIVGSLWDRVAESGR
jgi:hypothetical protein